MRRGRKVPRRTLIGRIAVGGPPCHVGWVTQLAAGAFVNVTSSLQHEDLRTKTCERRRGRGVHADLVAPLLFFT